LAFPESTKATTCQETWWNF